jgi:hypothetical protein
MADGGVRRLALIERLLATPPARSIALLFLPIAAIRVAMVLLFAPAIPYYDEWDGVVLGMAKPLLHHAFDPAFLLASHNGHPLFWTKLVHLAFLAAAGLRFDNVPVCVLNQFAYALAAAMLMRSVAARLGANGGWFLLVAALVLSVPFGWENITMGWNNQYLIATVFGIGLIVVCAHTNARARGMASIIALGAASAVSLASGLVAPLVGSGILLWRSATREIGRLRAACLCAVLAVCALLGFAIGRTSHAEGADTPLGATQFAELALLAVCWLPVWLHARRCFRGPRTAFDLAVIGAGCWAFAQIAAMILLRSHFRLWLPISRYLDIIAIGMLAVLVSLCRIAHDTRGPPFGLRANTARRALMVAAVTAALASPLAFVWQWRAAADHRNQEQLIRDYLVTRDPQLLRAAPQGSLAYPTAERLRTMLDDPDVDFIIGEAIARRR